MRKNVMLLALFLLAALSTSPSKLLAAQLTQSSTEARSDSFRCPDDYPSLAAKQAALTQFIKEYAKQFPNHTVRDLMVYRYHLLVSHSCTQTLQYMLAHVSPTAQMLRFNGRDFGPKTEILDPVTGVWSVFFKESGAQPAQPDQELIFNFYGWTPPTFPDSIMKNLLNRRDNVHTIWKFEAPDDITKAPAYFVVSETIYPGRPFGCVNLTKITSLGAGAYAVTFSAEINGANSAEIDKNIRSWLVGEQGRKVSLAIGYVGVDSQWQGYLAHSH